MQNILLSINSLFESSEGIELDNNFLVSKFFELFNTFILRAIVDSPTAIKKQIKTD